MLDINATVNPKDSDDCMKPACNRRRLEEWSGSKVANNYTDQIMNLTEQIATLKAEKKELHDRLEKMKASNCQEDTQKT